MFKITIVKLKCWFNLNLFGICLIIVSCVLVISASGCAKMQHLDQLLTLKGLSDEQAQMGKEIERQDARFERLVAAVEEGSIGKYKDQKNVQDSFGDPIYVTQTDGLDVWVYRYAVRFFDSPKVYLYWDRSGQMVQWKYEEGQGNGKIKQEASSKI